jgi:hypothetical protein
MILSVKYGLSVFEIGHLSAKPKLTS